jgi:plastocyanin
MTSYRSALALTATAVLALATTGCPEQKKPAGATGGKATAKPTGAATAKPTASAKAGGGEAAFGKGVIAGTVSFSGTAPEMKMPKKRGEADVCRDSQVKHNAVVVNDGKLQDVLVRIAPGQLEGDYEAEGSITLEQKDCVYTPRIQAALVEQEIIIKNSDPTLHNVNAGKGSATLFNTAQPKGAPDLKKSFDESGTYRFRCDVHPWMRAFVIINENPFYAVSGADGTFKIEKVPDGKYKMEAWHSIFGKKEAEVEVKGGEVKADFSYDGKEAEPAENQGELKDLF